ncbi:hypothetical protein RYZ20_02600 [Thioclava sp. A2]|uniref:hypothetical protein n=1 Tax=Thioclava sp. FCG-A2 TaxID=3080562 RepID=UPI0029536C43|nr:hypothetical protein [Thioclava sp. A2]MDV7269786.1 hypothetical protein [Thioclava sp. A2]
MTIQYSHHAAEPERRDLPLDALASRIGEELETLARLSADVQKALSLCEFAQHTDANAIRGLQGIDRITQALEDLGRLMSAVSGEISTDVKLHSVPLLSRLRLHELIINLDPSHEREVASRDDDGEVCWF